MADRQSCEHEGTLQLNGLYSYDLGRYHWSVVCAVCDQIVGSGTTPPMTLGVIASEWLIQGI